MSAAIWRTGQGWGRDQVMRGGGDRVGCVGVLD